ncbi:MAG: M20/M25/M40 family metallo-hydrolase, partial [Elusimicrobiota bacterium]
IRQKFLNQHNNFESEYIAFETPAQAQEFLRQVKGNRALWKETFDRKKGEAGQKGAAWINLMSLEALIDLWKIPKEDAARVLGAQPGDFLVAKNTYGDCVFRLLFKRTADLKQLDDKRKEYFRKALTGIKKHEAAMVRFARDLVAIPSFSTQEGPLVRRIAQEMKRNGFDQVKVDRMGNIIGRIGSGRVRIMLDAHIDTVGIGDRKAWKWDPFKGKYENGKVYGRGSADQKLSMVPMVYGGRILKDLGLTGDYTYLAVGSCQEEDCDGLPLLHIIQKEGIRPDYVVITESTELKVYRGHRGRMEIRVVCKGRSCHASAPERGINAVVHMTDIVREVTALNKRLAKDKF